MRDFNVIIGFTNEDRIGYVPGPGTKCLAIDYLIGPVDYISYRPFPNPNPLLRLTLNSLGKSYVPTGAMSLLYLTPIFFWP